MLAVSLGIVLATGTAAAVWLLRPPKYTASAQLHVSAAIPWLVYKDQDTTGREFATYMKTQSARIKSRFVLNAALKKDTVQNLEIVRDQAEPIPWLEDEVKVETQENSEYVTVSMMGTEPAATVAIVKAVVDCYIDEYIKGELKRKSDRGAELDKVHTQINEKVRLKKETLRKLAEQLGTSEREALT